MLRTLRVPEFDRYIKHYSLPIEGKKKNMQIYKIQCICHRISLIRRQRIHGSDTSRKKMRRNWGGYGFSRGWQWWWLNWHWSRQWKNRHLIVDMNNLSDIFSLSLWIRDGQRISNLLCHGFTLDGWAQAKPCLRRCGAVAYKLQWPPSPFLCWGKEN